MGRVPLGKEMEIAEEVCKNKLNDWTTRKLPRLNDRKGVNIKPIWTHLRSFNPGALAQSNRLIYSCTLPNRQQLVLLTHCYPFGDKESFVEEEIPYLMQTFSKVTVVPLFSRGKKRSLPKGVELLEMPEEGLLTKALRAATVPMTYSEVVKRPKNFASVKSIAGYVYQSDRAYRFYRALLQRAPHLRDALFYSYWFYAQTTAVALLKERDFPHLKLVSRAHGYDLYEEEYPPYFIPLRERTARALSRLYPISEDGKGALLKKMPFLAERVELSRLGVKEQHFSAEMSGEGNFSIASVSYLSEEKRIDLLIDSLAEWGRREKKLSIHWNHFGGGALTKPLTLQAMAKLPANVSWKFRGSVTKEELFAFYRRSEVDLFISTSRTEGIPVSMMEAASCGIPILATDVGGVREIVASDSGFLLEKYPAPGQVAEALSRISGERELLKGMKGAARNIWSKRFNREENFSQFANSLKELASIPEGEGKSIC